MSIQIIEADLNLPAQQYDTLMLIDAYARDPQGQGSGLEEEVLSRLIPGLQQHPTTHVFLAYQDTQAVGIAVCFLGFSTFAARPLMNIHDIAVLPTCRGQGTGQLLLAAVSRKSQELGCCKVTLEVMAENRRAKKIYEIDGFVPAQYGASAGGALFMTKTL